MANYSIKKLLGILYDVLVRVDIFIFLLDFVIIDRMLDIEIPINLGRPFLATSRVLVDFESGKLKFR